MVRLALGRLWHDWRRTLVMACALLLSVTSFLTLAGTASTQRLETVGTVAANYRSSYDVLVRPKGSVLPLEATEGLVRPNFLSGTYGGIGLDQVAQVAAIPGVEVAAPIASLGTVMLRSRVTIPVPTDGAGKRLFRLSSAASWNNGRTTVPANTGWLYLTPEPLMADAEGDVREGGGPAMCTAAHRRGDGPADPRVLSVDTCWSRADGDGVQNSRRQAEFVLTLGQPLNVAAVDPDAEARLVGLDAAALVDGRLLVAGEQSQEQPSDVPRKTILTTPALLSRSQTSDYTIDITVEELAPALADGFAALGDDAARSGAASAATPVALVSQRRVASADLYQQTFDRLDPAKGTSATISVTSWWQPRDVSYRMTDPLLPEAVPLDPAGYANPLFATGYEPVPASVQETGYRTLELLSYPNRTPETSTTLPFPRLQVVGRFDPTRLTSFSPLSAVPLETYASSPVVAGDEATRDVLGGQPLRPNLSLSDYLQQPPALLVPLSALQALSQDKLPIGPGLVAPVSAIRVRVAGVTGIDDASRERIRLVAEQIGLATGLEVDVTAGTSPAPRDVRLTTGMGSITLALNESWSKKGVAAVLLQAIDKKSALLNALILVSAALTVAMTAQSAVQARRRDLAMLACTGWRRGRLLGSVVLELALMGLVAGALGALLALPVTLATHVTYSPLMAALAVPGAVLLALLAGLGAALRAASVRPAAALRPAVAGGHRGIGHVHGPVGLGLALALRRPGRVLSGALAMALPMTALGVLAAVMNQFRGQAVGTLLGDAITLQVRGPDLVAAGLLAALGLLAVVTILLLGNAEDAPVHATLVAIGWRDARIATVVLTQAVVVSLLGLAVGAAATLALLRGLFGVLAAGVVAGVAWVAAGLLLLTLLVAVVPALAALRLPTARLLSQD